MSGCKDQGASCGTHESQERQLQEMEIRSRLSQIKNKILVMSGKGGVGKSSVAAYLAVCLAKKGYQVGLMDVDLHGPSIPRLLGLTGLLEISPNKKAVPVSCLDNLQVVSIESLLPDKDAATIWRGPLKIGVIRQFISDVEWRPLDYLIIDSPPGTGDEPLTVAQTISDAKALIVTTPQEISLADVRKSINFCRQVNLDILGIVENMSGLVCPHCGKSIDLFKQGGGAATAARMGVRFLGALPLEPLLVQEGDRGNIGVLDDNDLEFTKKFSQLVEQVVQLTPYSPPEKTTPQQVQGGEKMNGETIFAIPLAQGVLCNHFGHCEQFALIRVQEGKIVDKQLLVPPPHEPGVLPRWLSQQGAQVIIAGGMGIRAQDLFAQQGIKVITGAPVAKPEELVEQYLSQTLVTGPNVCDH